MIFNIQQLREWLQDALYIDGDTDYDGSDNRWEIRIYGHDGKFYQVNYLNGEPLEDTPKNKSSENTYTVTEVFRKERVITQVYWENGDGEEIFS